MSLSQNSQISHAIFLSSTVRHPNTELQLKEVREAAYSMGLEAGYQVYGSKIPLIYVDEHVHPRDNIGAGSGLLTVDGLLSALRVSEVFVCVIGNERHGSGIDISIDQEARVSFWEIELVFAALLNKPIYVLFRADMPELDYEPELRNVLSILAFAYPRKQWIPYQSDRELLGALRGILNSVLCLEEPKDTLISPTPSRNGNAIFGAFSYFRSGFTDSEIRFLSASEVGGAKPGNRADVERIFETSILSGSGNTSTWVSPELRLAKLWLIFREICGAKVDSANYQEYLPYWQRFYAEWDNACAWYGLHAHIYLGRIAALNSLADVLVIMRAQSSANLKDQRFAHPGGALASTYYSLAKRLPNTRQRRRELTKAKQHIGVSLSLQTWPESEANLLAIRGNVNALLAANGKPWCIFSAVEDLYRVVRLKTQCGASSSEIGKAEVELGYVLCRIHLRRKGLAMIEDGIAAMREDGNMGFYLRAMRKLGEALYSLGSRARAIDVWTEALTIANTKDVLVLDQAEQIRQHLCNTNVNFR